MAVKIARNPFYLIGKLPIHNMYDAMTHFAAMLDGSYLGNEYIRTKGWDDTTIRQRGITNEILPSEELEDLQKLIANNRNATILFATALLPIYFLMDMLKITLDTLKKAVNSTLLYAFGTPAAALLGGIARLARFARKKTGKYEKISGTNRQISTLVYNNQYKLEAELQPPFGIISALRRDGNFLTQTFQQRIEDTAFIFDNIFEVPHFLLQRLMSKIDQRPLLRSISWVLFPVRWALKMLEIGLETVGKTLSAVCKLVSYPIVGTVHGFSLIKYKSFKADVRNLDVEVGEKERKGFIVHHGADTKDPEFDQQNLEDLVEDGSSYKQLFNTLNLMGGVRLEQTDDGRAYLRGRKDIHERNDEDEVVYNRPNEQIIRIEITDANRDVILAGLKRNAFHWRTQLEMKVDGTNTSDFDKAVEICQNFPSLGGSEE